MKILILNGPNLNLLGKREPDIYGNVSIEQIIKALRTQYPDIDIHAHQSNIEGELINFIHQYGFDSAGVVFNAGAYTHTSVALHDAIKAVKAPVIEVHISNIHTREEYRHTSLIASACKGGIYGFGTDSYRLAVEAIIKLVQEDGQKEN